MVGPSAAEERDPRAAAPPGSPVRPSDISLGSWAAAIRPVSVKCP